LLIGGGVVIGVEGKGGWWGRMKKGGETEKIRDRRF